MPFGEGVQLLAVPVCLFLQVCMHASQCQLYPSVSSLAVSPLSGKLIVRCFAHMDLELYQDLGGATWSNLADYLLGWTGRSVVTFLTVTEFFGVFPALLRLCLLLA